MLCARERTEPGAHLPGGSRYSSQRSQPLAQIRERTCVSDTLRGSPVSHPCVRVHSTGLSYPCPWAVQRGTWPVSPVHPRLKGTPGASALRKPTLLAGLARPLNAGLFLGAALCSVSGHLSPEGIKLKAGKKEFFLRKDWQRLSKCGSWVITRSSAGDKFMWLIETSG